MKTKKPNPLRQLPSTSDGCGQIVIHLKEILEERQISLNQLSFCIFRLNSTAVRDGRRAIPLLTA